MVTLKGRRASAIKANLGAKKIEKKAEKLEHQTNSPETAKRERCSRMHYADLSELVAELILHPHACGPDCLCWHFRKVPAIDETLQRLGVPKYQTINEAVANLGEKLHAETAKVS